jgi:hypothetical protein
MRKNLLVTLALGAVLTLGVAAVAAAKFETFRAGNLVMKVDAGVRPKALPKKKRAPITLYVKAQSSTSNGAHPPAFRETTIDFDKNGAINTKGVPTCRGGQLEARDTKAAKKVCGSATVGSGKSKIEIAFPEQRPITVNSPITVFNGGTKGGKTTLFIHTFITVPVPAAVVTTVTVKKIRKGRYGLRAVAKIPVVAGGSGSVIGFEINFVRKYTYKGKKMSYFSARCRDGRFNADVKSAIFINEAGGPRTKTTLKGKVSRSCTPKG